MFFQKIERFISHFRPVRESMLVTIGSEQLFEIRRAHLLQPADEIAVLSRRHRFIIGGNDVERRDRCIDVGYRRSLAQIFRAGRAGVTLDLAPEPPWPNDSWSVKS